MEVKEAVTAVREVRSPCPFSLAFWNYLHQVSSSWQWERRDWYVSYCWSCSWIQLKALWYLTACLSSMIFSISLFYLWFNLQWFTRDVILVFRAWIPSSVCLCTSKRNLSQKCQKCFSDFMVVAMALRTYQGSSGSLRWLCQSQWGFEELFDLHPETIILSCFQPLWQGLSSSASMLRTFRKLIAWV